MKFGSWEIKVSTSGMPQKVATAFEALNEMVGVEYRFVAYLGSQSVNGINHAVLAEQTLITGKDIKNAVVVIFHETKEGVVLADIERVVEAGGEFGGAMVDVQTEIPQDAKDAFDNAFNGFVGFNVKPFVLVATQMVKGMNYVFVAETSPVVANPEKGVALVVVNSLTKDVAFVDILTNKHDSMSLGYAFTWLTRRDTSVAKPLGE